MRHVTPDTCHVTSEKWYVTPDMCHLTPDTLLVVNIVSKFQVSTSNGLG